MLENSTIFLLSSSFYVPRKSKYVNIFIKLVFEHSGLLTISITPSSHWRSARPLSSTALNWFLNFPLASVNGEHIPNRSRILQSRTFSRRSSGSRKCAQ